MSPSRRREAATLTALNTEMSFSPKQLDTLIQELVEGVLPEDQWPALKKELEESEHARQVYADYIRLHSTLDRRVRGLKAALANTPLIPADEFDLGRQRKAFRHAITAAAAVLIAAAVLMWRVLLPEPQTYATIETGPDVSLALIHPEGSEAEGQVLANGSRLIFETGIVKLTFDSGVTSIVQGPADLTFHDQGKLELTRGTGWFKVPVEASGFRVLTPEFVVVDLGTVFGVLSDADAPDEVHLFSGMVEIKSKSGQGSTEVLTTGAARRIAPDGTLSAIALDHSKFATSLSGPPIRHLHWAFDEGDPGRQQVRISHQVTPPIRSECYSPNNEDPFTNFTVVPGRFGNALSSMGRDGFVRTNWAGIEKGKPYTVCYWMRLAPGHHYHHAIVGWNAARIDDNLRSDLFSSSVRYNGEFCTPRIRAGSDFYDAITRIDDGQWHHLAIVNNGAGEVELFLDGNPEQLAPFEIINWRTAPDGDPLEPASSHTTGASPLSLLSRTWGKEKLGQDLTLAIVRENGTTKAYVDGLEVGSSTGFPPRLNSELTTLLIGANRITDGGLEGFFTGSIDRVRISTFTGSMGANTLLNGGDLQLTVLGDYTFDDNRIPRRFKIIGDPSCSDGRLHLDGDDAIELIPTPLTATDNFIIEAKLQMTEYPSNSRTFAVPVSNSDGFNAGWGLIYQHTWGGIIMGHSCVGSGSATFGHEVSLAIDELHIFEAALDAEEILNIYHSNELDPAPTSEPFDSREPPRLRDP